MDKKMYEVNAWAVSKGGSEIGGGHIGDAETMDGAVDIVLPYLERAIRGGGIVCGNIHDGFKFEDPLYNMADCTINIKSFYPGKRYELFKQIQDSISTLF